MATTTALQESSQALFCAIADFLGKSKSNNELTLTKYPTYQDFKLNVRSKTGGKIYPTNIMLEYKTLSIPGKITL